jgi:alkylhydroperoxidase family enzyme
MSAPRIAPVTPPFEPEIAARLDEMMPGAPPIALFRTFVRNMPMAEAMGPWGGYELSKGLSLTMRQRELVIDRVTARCRCEYEWGVHITFFGERVELTHDQKRSITHGSPSDPCWPDDESALLRAVDELHDQADVTDATWTELSLTLTEQQLLDVMMLAGWYHAISYVANAARIDLEEGVARFADFE